jgi:hypothetical protein
MQQQFWGYKAEEKIYLGVRGRKKVEYYCYRLLGNFVSACSFKLFMLFSAGQKRIVGLLKTVGEYLPAAV